MLDDGEKLVPGLPRGPRAARLGRRAAALPGRDEARSPTPATSRRTTRCSTTASATASSGFLTITGGKLTTFRLMAEDRGGRHVRAARRGPAVPHRTSSRCPAPRTATLPRSARGCAAREEHAARRPADLRVRAGQPRRGSRRRCARRGTTNLDDIRRSAAARAWARARAASASTAPTGILHGVERARRRRRRTRSLLDFLAGALEGRAADPLRRPVAPGALDDWVFQGLLDVEHLPARRRRRRPRPPAMSYDASSSAPALGRARRAALRLARGGRARARAGQGRRRHAPRRRDDRRPRLRPRARRRARARRSPAFVARPPRPPVRAPRDGVEQPRRLVQGALDAALPRSLRGRRSNENLLLPTALGVPKPSARRAGDDGRRRPARRRPGRASSGSRR